MAAGKKDEGKRPIIIKKVKKGGHGHHGGAWKVAYADFVTAMMAFFLLLWLLSTTSKSKLEGLAEYFTPTVGIKDSMGIGFKGGSADSEDGINKTSSAAPTAVTGRTPQGTVPENPDTTSKTESDQDSNLFKQGQTALEQTMAKDGALQQYKDNINIQMTPEGLKIDIMDSDKYAMFEPSTARLTVSGQAILGRISEILQKLPNYMSITGHTDASPAETGRADYTNWELSSDRAQSARRFMTKSGLEAVRAKKVIGMADKELFTPQEPRGPKNRRVSIIMLRGSHILIPDAALPKGTQPTADPANAPAPVQAPTAPAPAAH